MFNVTPGYGTDNFIVQVGYFVQKSTFADVFMNIAVGHGS